MFATETDRGSRLTLNDPDDKSAGSKPFKQ